MKYHTIIVLFFLVALCLVGQSDARGLNLIKIINRNTMTIVKTSIKLIRSLAGVVQREPKLKPNEDQVQHILDCYFHRFWERKTTALTINEDFCKRLATNMPRYKNKNKKYHKWFKIFRQIWHRMPEVEAGNLFLDFKPNEEEVAEIERCYFERSWHNKTDKQLTLSEAFCKRLENDDPNEIELRGPTIFEAYRKVWVNMGREDYDRILECLPYATKGLIEQYNGPCHTYYRSIYNRPRNWRDIRRTNYHNCKDPAMVPSEECLKLIQEYDQLYYPYGLPTIAATTEETEELSWTLDPRL